MNKRAGDARTWLHYTRFSIRESLLVIMVVAFGLGWLINRFQLSATTNNLRYWRECVGAMEFVFSKEGWDMEVRNGRLYVTRVANDPDISVYYTDLGQHEPHKLVP